MKATHQGHCQLCGRFQRLPGGSLAKHGYTVEFNFFNGVCPGSHHLPYEQSCDLLPARRDWAATTAKQLRKSASEVRALRDPKAVWIHEYQSGTYSRRRGGSTYVWKQVAPRFEEYKRELSAGSFFTATYVTDKGVTERLDTYTANESIDAIVAYFNAKRAAEIEGNAKQHADYATWAQKRIDAWKLEELTPIKEAS